MAKKPVRAIITRREYITYNLRRLWLCLDPKDRFSFKPGQYCTIEYEGIARAYSIASAPHAGFIELFVELVPPPYGNLTPLLWKLGVGNSVLMYPRAKGVFALKENARNHVFVSTVTGVAPVMSILRDRYHHKDRSRRFFVLHGASYKDELGYEKELCIAMQRGVIDIRCVLTVSRPDEQRNEGWKGEHGRVNMLVEKYLGQWALNPQDTIVYACGHPGMIEDLKLRLLPSWRFVEERFWKQ